MNIFQVYTDRGHKKKGTYKMYIPFFLFIAINQNNGVMSQLQG